MSRHSLRAGDWCFRYNEHNERVRYRVVEVHRGQLRGELVLQQEGRRATTSRAASTVTPDDGKDCSSGVLYEGRLYRCSWTGEHLADGSTLFAFHLAEGPKKTKLQWKEGQVELPVLTDPEGDARGGGLGSPAGLDLFSMSRPDR